MAIFASDVRRFHGKLGTLVSDWAVAVVAVKQRNIAANVKNRNDFFT
jgi:hypothetical protein